MILTTVISTTIENAEVVQFYTTLLENQSSNFSTLINFFLAISGILITASLAYNYIIAKNQIKNEVEKEVKNIEENLKVKFDIYLKEEIKKIEESFNNKLLYIEATIFMSISKQCLNNHEYSGCITFYFYALKRYLDLEYDIPIRQVIDNICYILTNPVFAPDINMEQLDYDDIVNILNKFPNILAIEKENILKKLELLKAGTKN